MARGLGISRRYGVCKERQVIHVGLATGRKQFK